MLVGFCLFRRSIIYRSKNKILKLIFSYFKTNLLLKTNVSFPDAFSTFFKSITDCLTNEIFCDLKIGAKAFSEVFLEVLRCL